MSQICAEVGEQIVCVGIPKTVDNDLAITDCSPGFGSTAKYLATSLREAAFDLAAMSRTHDPGVLVLEVMGRHAGWTTAACALAAEQEGDAPHILLMPEVAFNEDRFLAKVADAFSDTGCVVAVSKESKCARRSVPLRQLRGMPSAMHATGRVAPLITSLIGAKLPNAIGRFPIICSGQLATLPPRPMWSRPTLSVARRSSSQSLEGAR